MSIHEKKYLKISREEEHVVEFDNCQVHDNVSQSEKYKPSQNGV